MLESIEGREIVLAGGAGGLGSATATLLRDEGARLIISYRSNRERAKKWEAKATVVACDLTIAADRSRLLDAASDLYGLVVFAGDPARFSSPQDLEGAMRRSHEINYLGPLLLAREAAQRMRFAKTQGAIVLLSTMQANGLFAGTSAYATQKVALQYAARILAKECSGPTNIRVNVVSPGVMAAGMAEASIASGKYDRYLQEGRIARYGRAEDVARAVRFLLEPDSYITGQVLGVDGGITL